MYDRDVVELALLALEEGMTQAEAAELCGASRAAVSKWASGAVPHRRPEGTISYRTVRKAVDPLDEAERAAYEAAMTENMLLRAVLDDLKGAGSRPVSMSNRRKCELGERLRAATGLPLREITAFLRISRSSYEYHRARLGRDRDAALRPLVREAFAAGRGAYGYRRVWAELRRRGVRATDITEFRLPDDPRRVYLSPCIDLFDGAVVAFSCGTSPPKALVSEMLGRAVAAAGGGFLLHSDRGWHYRTPDWVGACEAAGVTRSMSRRGHSPDNAACEGFFGRLKVEFFLGRDWSGWTAEGFAEELSGYIGWYGEGRLKAFSEGGRTVYDTIAGRRRRLGLAA